MLNELTVKSMEIKTVLLTRESPSTSNFDCRRHRMNVLRTRLVREKHISGIVEASVDPVTIHSEGRGFGFVSNFWESERPFSEFFSVDREFEIVKMFDSVDKFANVESILVKLLVVLLDNRNICKGFFQLFLRGSAHSEPPMK